MQPTLVSAPDLASSPGLQPCDRCELIVACEWFGSFWLCEACRARAELPHPSDNKPAIGLEAAGRAIERLADLHRRTEELQKQTAALNKRMLELVVRVGDPGRCKGCQAPIFWVRHRSTPERPEGAIAPYDPDGVSHFATCPKRAQFKKARA